MELCECVTYLAEYNLCEDPLVANPLTFDTCITVEELWALKDHGLDENCLPIRYAGKGHNLNIFNFYGPIYGDINGFVTDSDGH